MTDVVTRFAPSPTGLLHIGGVRTALFNWLYARRTGGKILLRIEDTDRARSTQEAVAAIFDGLKWLGIDYDDEPVYQSSRIERHVEVAEHLLKTGHAYLCQAAPKHASSPEPEDGQVVRLKIPKKGDVVIEDLVHGKVVFKQDSIDDFVLLRSDGTPTYMLAVVVDDHDMGITHIIRGNDHLANSPRQKQIYEALGWEMPKMTHVPLIHGADGAKLSKRHGAVGIETYRREGYMPEAILNYLARLGWSHGDDEIFSMAQATDWFDPSDISKSPARFDVAKLRHLNAHYIRHSTDEKVMKHTMDFVASSSDPASLAKWKDESAQTRVLTAMSDIKQRARTLLDILEGASFAIVERPVVMYPDALDVLDGGGREIIVGLLPKLEDITEDIWSSEVLHSMVRSHAEGLELKLVEVAQPLRSALIGSTRSIGVFEIMQILGRRESIDRISDQVSTT